MRLELPCGRHVKGNNAAQGPGMCHGVSGNGYALLSAYQHTGDARHLVRSLHFAAWLIESWQQLYGHADRPLSLFEVRPAVFQVLRRCLKICMARKAHMCDHWA